MVTRFSVSLSLLLIVTAAPALGGAGFDVTVPGSVDTPDRTVTFQGSEYTVSTVAKTTPNGTLPVQVTAPRRDSLIYRVYLYDANRRIVDSRRGTETSRFEFDTGNVEPGSYLLVVQHDGAFVAIHPVVVRSYTVDVEVPQTVHRGPTDVTVRLVPEGTRHPIEEVEVVVANDTETLSTTATRTGDDTYRATVTLSELAPGDYTLYAAVRGPKVVFGRTELLGISDATTIGVTDDRPTAGDATARSTDTPVAGTTTGRTGTEPPGGAEGAVITPAATETPGDSHAEGQGGLGAATALAAVAAFAAARLLRGADR